MSTPDPFTTSGFESHGRTIGFDWDTEGEREDDTTLAHVARSHKRDRIRKPYLSYKEKQRLAKASESEDDKKS